MGITIGAINKFTEYMLQVENLICGYFGVEQTEGSGKTYLRWTLSQANKIPPK